VDLAGTSPHRTICTSCLYAIVAAAATGGVDRGRPPRQRRAVSAHSATRLEDFDRQFVQCSRRWQGRSTIEAEGVRAR